MRRSLLLVLVVLAALPGTASAQRCVAPPGTAAIEQYCETVPTARGERTTDQRGPAATVPGSTATQLAGSGKDGAALARELGVTATGKKPPRQKVKGAPVSKGSVPQAPSENPLSAVKQSVTSGTTIGGTFVGLLLVATLAVSGIAWLGYRRRRTDPE